MYAVALRRYLLDLMKAERQRLDEREKMNQRQLKIQHREYERRLKSLNHEAARIAKIQEDYVPRETFDAFVTKYDEDAKRIREALSLASGQKLGSSEIITRFMASASFVGIIIGILTHGHF
jgi:multidrug resistance efflux pump